MAITSAIITASLKSRPIFLTHTTFTFWGERELANRPNRRAHRDLAKLGPYQSAFKNIITLSFMQLSTRLYRSLLNYEKVAIEKLQGVIIIKMLRQIIIGVILSIAVLPIEASHLYWRHPNHHKNTGSDVIGVLLFIGLLCGGIAYLVYRCRRRRNTAMPPPPLPLPPQPPLYRPHLQVNPYQGFQTNNFSMPNNRYNSPAPARVQNDITRAANQNSFAQKWQGPDYFAQKRLREGCACCNSVTRYGQEPKIVLSCPQHHAFHISCLNQFRISSRMMPSDGNKNVCPACNMPAPERVRLFCLACKQAYIWVQLSKFSDQDRVIDITALKNQYGEYCSDCRNV